MVTRLFRSWSKFWAAQGQTFLALTGVQEGGKEQGVVTGGEGRGYFTGGMGGITWGRMVAVTGGVREVFTDHGWRGEEDWIQGGEVREGSIKKTSLFIHILWISVLPPPLIHVGGFYNNIIKLKYYPHRLTPPLPPLSTFWTFIIFLKKYYKNSKCG